MPNSLARSLTALLLGLCLLPSVGHAQDAAPPAVTLPGGVTRLDDVGLYAVTYRYDDGRTGAMPLGWAGPFTDDTGIACEPAGVQDGRDTFLLHPPWHGGTGDTDQTFRLTLPRATKITLAFAVAMQIGATGPKKSDGAVFRVFLDGRPLLDRLKTDSAWSASEFDLTPQAGRTVTLRFETDPGPARSPSYDFALWGDRAITVTGAPAPSRPSQPLPEWSGVSPAGSAWGGVSPKFSASLAAQSQPAAQADPKAADLLDGWALTIPGQTLPLSLAHGAYLELVGPDGKIVRSDAPEVARTMTQESLPDGTIHRQMRYQIGTRTITVTADLSPPRGGCARAVVRSDDPFIAAVHFGDVGPAAFRRPVLVPYLGTVDYLPDLRLFARAFPDHTLSQASALDNTTALYQPLTDGRRNAVRETAYFAVSPDFHAVLPTPNNPPSPYRELLGDKVVLDVWGGHFDDNAARLREYQSYGLTHFLTIVHDWQNGGYDNKLPDVLPAQPGYGGDPALAAWAKAGIAEGGRFALHENYVDFYPNAASYDEQDVAHDSAGHLVPAWKNLIQSYAVAPTAILKYAKKITPEVHARIGTNASYLDVHSAVPPWFHVDFRADQPGAGKFQTVWDAHRDLWALFRKTHGGPVLGEGANHWYWSGLLDGVEAQFGVGITNGETAPLFVDFDLLKIHPLQFNHGMGYLERWYQTSSHADWDGLPPPKVLDQYRMQEIAYGHDGFVAANLWSSPPFVWQESGLVRPVTRAYATAQAVGIDYDVDGSLVGTNAALASEKPLDRVRVRYDNGLTVWANGRASDWTIRGPERLTLPQYGWVAQGRGLLAYTALRDGVVADYAETPDSLFADARTVVPGPKPPLRVTPGVSQFTQTGPRAFAITFRWDVGEAVPAGYVPFVHVTGASATQAEGISFQFGDNLPTPATWPVGRPVQGTPVAVTLPADLKDGTYTIKVGLYNSKGGDRLALTGRDDGGRRFTLGALVVSDAGRTLAWQPETGGPTPTLNRTEHTNPTHKIVSFGKIATDGSVSLERRGPGDWRLIPFPRTQPFNVALYATRIDPKLLPLHVQALDARGKPLGLLPLVFAGMSFPPHFGNMFPTQPGVLPLGWAQFQVNTLSGAFSYRLTGGGK